MKYYKYTSNFGPSGLADVRILKSKIVVQMEEGSFELDPADNKLPTWAKSGKWFVGLSESKDKINTIRPVEGKFLWHFVKFAAAKDSPPVYDHKQATYTIKKTGKPFSVDLLQFKAVLEVVDGPYEGLQVTLPGLLYKNLDQRSRGAGFSVGDDGLTIITGGDKNVQDLLRFMSVTGAMEVDMPFSDNLLPALERIIQNKDRSFWASLVNGWLVRDSLEEYVELKPKSKKKNSKAPF